MTNPIKDKGAFVQGWHRFGSCSEGQQGSPARSLVSAGLQPPVSELWSWSAEPRICFIFGHGGPRSFGALTWERIPGPFAVWARADTVCFCATVTRCLHWLSHGHRVADPQSRALSASGSPSILVKAHNSPEPHSRFFSLGPLGPLGPSSAYLAWPAPIAGPRHEAPRRCQSGRRTPSRSIHPASAAVRAARHRRLLLGEHLFSPSRIPIRNSRSVLPPPR